MTLVVPTAAIITSFGAHRSREQTLCTAQKHHPMNCGFEAPEMLRLHGVMTKNTSTAVEHTMNTAATAQE